MVRVTLVGKMLMVSDVKTVGKVYRSRVRAIRMYMVVAGRLLRVGRLDAWSCIYA